MATRQPTYTTYHGVTLEDPYAWLRDANWREAMHDSDRLHPEIRRYLDAENDHTHAHEKRLRPLTDTLVSELRGRIPGRDSGVPVTDGPWCYYTRFRDGGQHPIFCRAPREDAATNDNTREQILLDGDAEANNYDYFNLGGVAHSRDHTLIAFGVDTRGAEAFDIRIRRIASGDDIQPPIPNTTGGVDWSAASDFVFYVTLDSEHRPNKVWRQPIDAGPEAAIAIYEEADPGFFVGLDTTQSGAFVVINAHDHETSEAWVIPADAPETAPRLIAARQTGREYEIEHAGDTFIIATNADGADDYKLVYAPINAPDAVNWQPLVDHAPGRLILEFIEFAQYRVRLERVDALPRIVYTDKATGVEHTVDFDAEAYSLAIQAGIEFDTTTLRFTYTAPDTPAETYDFDLATGQRTLRKRREIPSGFDATRFRVWRVHAEARDGARIPITVTAHADTPLDGSATCVLQGYGAYGISEPAAFSSHRLSLVERGMVVATAHVRGGRERGQAWYEAGKLAHKPNTFSDFIAAAEHLADTGFSRRGRIAALGGSAGGMLVGAVLNQRPDLFGAAVADVPFVDVLNTMLDASLPLTPPEWPEWGNPRDDAEAFTTIRSYCPYQNITAQTYPPILAIAGVSDPRVTYWEPAKWVAKLRATKTDTNRLLLKTHMGAGHGGVPGRFAALDEIALIYAFLLTELGVIPAEVETA
ncbi:S9 family peptidase [Salinisphaera sp. USBA-960]|nr:S9 family peptidase [Salifodinibacter halophilus]NNC26721.1 S9 family peptidase [Salifodinibacter halophilus]